MERTALSCALFAIFLSMSAESADSPTDHNSSQDPEPTAFFNSGKPVSKGALLLLIDSMKRGHSLLKERLKDSYSDLKDEMKDGDSLLKERISEGVAEVKGQLKEGEDRLNEQLGEDVAWLKDKLYKGQGRLKEQLEEEEAETKEELTEQKDDLENLRHSVKEWRESNRAVVDDLKQQMSAFGAELKSTKALLQSTQTQLRTTQDNLQTTQDNLQTTQDSLHSTQDKLQFTQDKLQSTQADLEEKARRTEGELQRTREELHEEVQDLAALKTGLQTAQGEILSLQAEVDRLRAGRRSGLSESAAEGDDLGFSDIGSTFIRWGSTSCPDNTSLVYSGIAGGSWFGHTGGGSNYLCLVPDPQLSNSSVPSSLNYLYGVEYEVPGEHYQHDVVCSVCRAPKATTIMIPATPTCPPGWSSQYRGQLMSAYHDHKGRTEYVCVDEVMEHNVGGHENKNGALMYPVVTQCGSLPCPPYVHNRLVTCVVCSV